MNTINPTIEVIITFNNPENPDTIPAVIVDNFISYNWDIDNTSENGGIYAHEEYVYLLYTEMGFLLANKVRGKYVMTKWLSDPVNTNKWDKQLSEYNTLNSK